MFVVADPIAPQRLRPRPSPAESSCRHEAVAAARSPMTGVNTICRTHGPRQWCAVMSVAARLHDECREYSTCWPGYRTVPHEMRRGPTLLSGRLPLSPARATAPCRAAFRTRALATLPTRKPAAAQGTACLTWRGSRVIDRDVGREAAWPSLAPRLHFPWQIARRQPCPPSAPSRKVSLGLPVLFGLCGSAPQSKAAVAATTSRPTPRRDANFLLNHPIGGQTGAREKMSRCT